MRSGTQSGPDTEVKDLRLEENSQNHAPSKHLRVCFCLIAFLAAGLGPRASAEDPDSVLPYSMAPRRSVEMSLWYAEPVPARGFNRIGWLGESDKSAGQLQFEVLDHSWLSERSLTLFQTRLPSRFAYDAWAKVVTSYGQFFPDNTLSRSRITGYDMLDPDWFYIKVTFKF